MEVFGLNAKRGYPCLLFPDCSKGIRIKSTAEEYARVSSWFWSARPWALRAVGAPSWKLEGSWDQMWMGNVDCSSGASASVGHLPIKCLGKSNDSVAISQEFLESLSSQASSMPCSSLCSQQLHQQDDFSHPGGGNAVLAAVQMCTE